MIKLNTQLFAESAANDVDEPIDKTPIADGDVKFDEPGDVKPAIDQTKAFSDRLKAKTSEVEKEYNAKMDTYAKSKGFDSFEDLKQADNEDRINKLGVENKEEFDNYLKDAIKQDPTVIEAQKIIHEREQAEIKETLNTQLKRITEINPEIKSLEDLSELQNFDDFYKKVKSGYDLYDAYIVTSFNEVSDKKLSAAQQKVINNINSKSHMKGAAGSKSTEVKVPDDIMSSYRVSLPKWTDEQIKEHYIKQTGGN